MSCSQKQAIKLLEKKGKDRSLLENWRPISPVSFHTKITVKFQNKRRGLYFSKALFEGLIFGGAYLRRKICVSKSIGLALQLEVNLPFLLCFTLHLRAIIQVQAPGRHIWRGDLTEGFSRYQFGGLYLEGLIHGGAYFRNFTVCPDDLSSDYFRQS